MRLSDAELNKEYIIKNIDLSAPSAARLKQLGFAEGALTVPLHEAPVSREPRAYYIKGCVIALRREDTSGITVEPKERGCIQ
ncbi:MAG: ferrous iron transport protein A [Firmicutes bacterium]|nr:ferrous iron transport protein A [Bacillota bacterium]MBQ9604451.1 ferrous iron transport protein A [Bacillota bacterium]